MNEYYFANPAVILACIVFVPALGLMLAANYAHYVFLRDLREKYPAFWKEQLGNPSMTAARAVFRVPRNVHALTMKRLEPTCTNCDYLLRGLPTNGKCPECGTAYDRRESAMDESGVMGLCLRFDKLMRRLKIAMWLAVGLTAALLAGSFVFKW